MRVKQRYKRFSKHFLPLACLPKEKILKFHRTKWKKIQKLILKEKLVIKHKIKFKSVGKIFCCASRWERLSYIFCSQVLFKKTIQTLFFNNVFNSTFKNLFLKTFMNKFAHLQSLLCRLEYRIDILLLRLKLFSNYTTVKKNLYDRIILINNKHYKFAISLVKGDVLSITSCSILTFTKRLKDCYFLHTFIEIDYYTKKIVIIKDLKALTNKDFLLLYRELYNTLDLRDYLLY